MVAGLPYGLFPPALKKTVSGNLYDRPAAVKLYEQTVHENAGGYLQFDTLLYSILAAAGNYRS